jgi:hypothetical protein
MSKIGEILIVFNTLENYELYAIDPTSVEFVDILEDEYFTLGNYED